MRLSTDTARDEDRALATLRAALNAGIDVLDTARSYGWDDADAGHNERLVGRAIRAHARSPSSVRIVTKCGMRRPLDRDGAPSWMPDGRAGAIADDVRASREAFGDLPIDLVLLHARDPKTPLATSVRALARAADGVARAIGLSNVSLAEPEEARGVARRPSKDRGSSSRGAPAPTTHGATPRAGSPRTSPPATTAPSTSAFARIRRARRSAGAARPSPAYGSRSRTPTASTPRAASSSPRPPRTRPSRARRASAWSPSRDPIGPQ